MSNNLELENNIELDGIIDDENNGVEENSKEDKFRMELHKTLFTSSIYNKFYIDKNNEVKEKEGLESSDNKLWFKRFIETVSGMGLVIYSDKDIIYDRTSNIRDKDLYTALEYFGISSYNFGIESDRKISSLCLVQENQIFSFNQISSSSSIKTKDILTLCLIVKEKLNLIKTSKEPEKIIYDSSSLLENDFNSTYLINYSEDKKSFLISNIVLFTILKHLYRIEIITSPSEE